MSVMRYKQSTSTLKRWFSWCKKILSGCIIRQRYSRNKIKQKIDSNIASTSKYLLNTYSFILFCAKMYMHNILPIKPTHDKSKFTVQTTSVAKAFLVVAFESFFFSFKRNKVLFKDFIVCCSLSFGRIKSNLEKDFNALLSEN